jgi:hypothetical protein
LSWHGSPPIYSDLGLVSSATISTFSANSSRSNPFGIFDANLLLIPKAFLDYEELIGGKTMRDLGASDDPVGPAGTFSRIDPSA